MHGTPLLGMLKHGCDNTGLAAPVNAAAAKANAAKRVLNIVVTPESGFLNAA
jgi:hypothetical protein